MTDQPPEPGTLLIVDAANVVGSVPDGWWRDRAGAAARLRDRLRPVAATGLPGLAAPLEVVLVVEGRARGVASVAGVRAVAAAGSGDDAIVDLVRAAAGRACVVVTADRELRARVTALGGQVRGPRLLHQPEGTGGSPHEPGGAPVRGPGAPCQPDETGASPNGRDKPGYPPDRPVAPDPGPQEE